MSVPKILVVIVSNALSSVNLPFLLSFMSLNVPWFPALLRRKKKENGMNISVETWRPAAKWDTDSMSVQDRKLP